MKNMHMSMHNDLIATSSGVFKTVVGQSNNSHLQHTDNQREELIKQFNRWLVEMEYGITRKELKTKDMIDLRPLLDMETSLQMSVFAHELTDKTQCIPKIKEEYLKLIRQHNVITRIKGPNAIFFNAIPCFKEGSFQINKNRYLYWNLQEIQTDTHTMQVHLMDYMACDGYWQPGVSAIAEITLKDTISNSKQQDQAALYDLRYKYSKGHLFSHLYKSITDEEQTNLGWTEHDKRIWKSIVIKFAEKTEEKMQADYNTDNIAELIKLFIMYVNLTNTLLALNKPTKAKPTHKHTITANTKIKTSNEMPKKSVRMIGPISIRSEKPPKLPTEKTMIHYKVASWKTRGFIRTLKSGKQVYVKESIHHRKCLNKNKQTPSPAVIKFKNRKDE